MVMDWASNGMKLSEELAWRGLIKDKTFEDVGWLDKPQTFYHGVDVGSADSLTIGNLAAMLLAKRLALAGWKPIILVGGATSLIGDPGGKSEERELVSREQVEHNKKAITKQIERIFDGQDFTLVDNYDWFKDVGYLEFLREVGKHYSMTELVQREYISARMGDGGSGISYAEFSYSLIQGYDFWHLFRQNGAVLQVGGSDQWGNMLSGVPLIRKKEGKEAHALSMPLIIDKETGNKFGKSEGGAIWLDSKKTSPTQFYQFWMNLADYDLRNFFEVYTYRDKSEVDQIMDEHTRNPGHRYGQRVLAHDVTAIVHGQDEAGWAGGVTKILTGETSFDVAAKAELDLAKKEIPYLKVPTKTSIVDVLVKSGLVSSRTEAIRLMSNGAIYINNARTNDEVISDEDFVNNHLLIRRGKAYKDSALIEKE